MVKSIFYFFGISLFLFLNCSTTEKKPFIIEDSEVNPETNQIIDGFPYFYQYSNKLLPEGTCQNTCIAMVLKYYAGREGKEKQVIDGITPDYLTTKWGNKKAQSVEGLEQVFNDEAKAVGLTIRGKGTTTASLDEFRALAKSGRPSIVHGYFTAYGHIMVVLGYDGSHYFCNDPAGKWSQEYKNGGYSAANENEGIGVKYKKEAFEKAIAPDNMVWVHSYE
jgi:predicted double-glycine peptidase